MRWGAYLRSADAASGPHPWPGAGAARLKLAACLSLLFLLSFAARFALVARLRTPHRPDEVFQTLEPAFRLATGWGVVTWEWRDGIRSVLLPGLLAGLIRLGDWAGLTAQSHVLLVWAALAALASLVAVAGGLVGWRSHGPWGAVIVGALCGLWPDLVYFGPRTLTEVQAGNLLLIAAVVVTLAPGGAARGAVRARLATGALLGLAFALRFQLAPALLLVAAWSARGDLRRGWVPLAAGAALPLLALGVSDWVVLGSPFQSVWKNFHVNLILGRSQAFGVMPVHWYAAKLVELNGAATIPLVVCFCLGARRVPLLAATAVAVVLAHSAVGHKEISFIYAALPLAMVTCGVGATRIAVMLTRLHGVPFGARGAAGLVLASWLAICATTGWAALQGWWQGSRSTPEVVWREVARQPSICGIGLYGASFPWSSTGGIVSLGRETPLYLLRSAAELQRATPGINYAIAQRDLAPTATDFAIRQCSSGYCLLHREAGCTPVPELLINRVLEAEGQ